MAHNAKFQVPWRPLGKENIVFEVDREEERVIKVKGKRRRIRQTKRLGTLKISKGAVVWYPGRKQRGYKMPWGRFDTVMQERGTRGNVD